MAAELPRPGVEVIQQFRTTSPTIVTRENMFSIENRKAMFSFG